MTPITFKLIEPMEENLIEKIEQYLRGGYHSNELKQIEKEIAESEALQRELKRQKFMLDEIERIEDSKNRAQVQAIHQQALKTRATFRKMGRFRYLAVAAGFTLLVVAGWLLIQNETPKDLFAANYEVPQLKIGNRGEAEIIKEKMIEAGNFYSEGNYSRAIPLFEEILSLNAQNDKAQFGLSIGYIETENYAQAITNLEKLIDSKSEFFADKAHWYLALIYLKQENIEKAKKYLTVLKANTDADFHYKSIGTFS